MAKHFLDDMVRDKRRRQGKAEVKAPIKEEIERPRTIKEVSYSSSSSKEPQVLYSPKRSRYLLWFVALVSASFCLFAVSVLFARATVRVEPRIQTLQLNENLVASRGALGSGLLFDLVIISGEVSKKIQATGEEDVRKAATGTVVLYNNFSSSSQNLSIDTRLEGSNGKIYKTREKITVPGKSAIGTPGSIEVEVYAAEAGEGYNSGPLDFTILGFKGTPKYAGFYGRSKGEISGGFVGKAPVVKDSEKSATLSELKESLRAKLFKNATGETPEGFVLFEDSVFLDIGEVNFPSSEDGSVNMTLRGTLYGILFNEESLTQKIVKDNIGNYDGSEVYISNIADLKFSLPNPGSGNFENLTNINFNLKGAANVVWKLDAEKFTTDLLAKSKKDFNQVLSEHPNIDGATLTLSPIWRMSLPDEKAKINVIVNYPH